MQAAINGIKLAFTDEGRGAPLVFIHGFPFNRAVWQPQVDAFRARYRVIAPDLRGFGESETLSSVSTMAQFADDVHTLLNHLHSGPVVLIGHSMGGYVALAFVRQYPAMLRGLMLVGTRSGADTPETAAGRRATARKVKTEGVDVVVDAMAPKMLSPKNSDIAMASRVRELMSHATPTGVSGALLGMAERPDSTQLLSKISVPTLIVAGADDMIIPPIESEKLADTIKEAQLKIIPDAGHLVTFEKPAQFNRALTEWLERTGNILEKAVG